MIDHSHSFWETHVIIDEKSENLKNNLAPVHVCVGCHGCDLEQMGACGFGSELVSEDHLGFLEAGSRQGVFITELNLYKMSAMCTNLKRFVFPPLRFSQTTYCWPHSTKHWRSLTCEIAPVLTKYNYVYHQALIEAVQAPHGLKILLIINYRCEKTMTTQYVHSLSLGDKSRFKWLLCCCVHGLWSKAQEDAWIASIQPRVSGKG